MKILRKLQLFYKMKSTLKEMFFEIALGNKKPGNFKTTAG